MSRDGTPRRLGDRRDRSRWPARRLVIWADATAGPGDAGPAGLRSRRLGACRGAIRGRIEGRFRPVGRPGSPAVYARTLARLGRDSAASAIYDGRLASAELEPEDAFLKGLVMARTGRPEAALELWDGYREAAASIIRDARSLRAALRSVSSASTRRWMRRGGSAASRAGRRAACSSWGRSTSSSTIRPASSPRSSRPSSASRRPAAPLFDAAHYRKLLARNLLRLGRRQRTPRRQLEASRPAPGRLGSSATEDGRPSGC